MGELSEEASDRDMVVPLSDSRREEAIDTDMVVALAVSWRACMANCSSGSLGSLSMMADLERRCMEPVQFRAHEAALMALLDRHEFDVALSVLRALRKAAAQAYKTQVGRGSSSLGSRFNEILDRAQRVVADATKGSRLDVEHISCQGASA